MNYRVRLRVRLSMALNTDDHMRVIPVADRQVTVTSQHRHERLSEALWVIFSAGGFYDEVQARSYGERLREIVELSGLCSGLGVDAGQDQSSATMNEAWARSSGLIKPHERLYPNVHGLTIIPDDENNRFPGGEVRGSSRLDPQNFFCALTEIGDGASVHLSAVKDGVCLLNHALLNPHPLGQLVLALSAVEALGQSETWTPSQVALIHDLAKQAETQMHGGNTECLEVAEAIRRSLHRVGLRQGVLRVLGELNLAHLKKEWDKIYQARSGIFHGTSKLNQYEISQLAFDAVKLCGQIILTFAEQKGVNLPSISLQHLATK